MKLVLGLGGIQRGFVWEEKEREEGRKEGRKEGRVLIVRREERREGLRRIVSGMAGEGHYIFKSLEEFRNTKSLILTYN